MAEEEKYLFGPVPSRRLGRSLGIDIVPFKTCSLDCIYCQLGKTTEKTVERREYLAVKPVLDELKERLAQGIKADFITISGSGEPTLNSRLGEFIAGIKKITNIPLAILTNGTLLYREDVRADCAKADVVLPSLDAGDMQTFEKVNRPHGDISIERLISGLCAFRKDYTGLVWLEVFLVEGLNTTADAVEKIKDAVEKIRPDKVQLNTAVRPTAEAGIKKLDAERMQEIAARLGQSCEVEVVTDFSQRPGGIENEDQGVSELHFGQHQKLQTLLSMLKRRPCSLKDICASLSLHRNEALKYLGHLQNRGDIDTEQRDGVLFFKAN